MTHTPDDHAGLRSTDPDEGDRKGATSGRSVRGRPRWLRRVAIAAVAALTAIVVLGAFVAVRLITNVESFELNAGGQRSGGFANDRTDRLQILVLGSDTRAGPDGEAGSAEYSESFGQSDVMMLVDIAEGNDEINVVSFPRDLLVDVPACIDSRNGQIFDARPGAMINSAMRDAGPGCAVDTVNALTGLEVDHFVLADFHAVVELSDAVGGVDVCVTAAIDEPKSGLKLPAGTSSIQGEQALAFLRARAAFANGGDLGRIQAQQAFLGSLTRKIRDEGTLRDPYRILRIADAVTRNLTVDHGLASLPTMVVVADRLRNINPADVNFIAVPTVPAADPNRLQLDADRAPALFAALRTSADRTAPGPTDASALPTRSAVAADPSIDRTKVPLGSDTEDGLNTPPPDVSGTISQTAEQVSCQEANPVQ